MTKLLEHTKQNDIYVQRSQAWLTRQALKSEAKRLAALRDTYTVLIFGSCILLLAGELALRIMGIVN